MVDHEWLKNLASAHLDGGELTPADPEGVRQRFRERLREAVNQLCVEADEACAVFNQYAGNRKNLRAIAMRAPQIGGSDGAAILLGRCQMRLAQNGDYLEATLTVMENFSTRCLEVRRFAALTDGLGSLFWRLDNHLHLSGEMVIKQLLEDLIKAAHEFDEF